MSNSCTKKQYLLHHCRIISMSEISQYIDTLHVPKSYDIYITIFGVYYGLYWSHESVTWYFWESKEDFPIFFLHLHKEFFDRTLDETCRSRLRKFPVYRLTSDIVLYSVPMDIVGSPQWKDIVLSSIISLYDDTPFFKDEFSCTFSQSPTKVLWSGCMMWFWKWHNYKPSYSIKSFPSSKAKSPSRTWGIIGEGRFESSNHHISLCIFGSRFSGIPSYISKRKRVFRLSPSL